MIGKPPGRKTKKSLQEIETTTLGGVPNLPLMSQN